MATRNIKDAKDLTTGELIYFKGHAHATFMSDGRTVEEAVSGISGGSGGSIDTSNFATKDELDQKQDVISDIDTIRSNAANYKGTVTGVKINGTTKNPSDGVVNLGTVITAHQDISGKQDTLVSGTNIKTINGSSILGSGNIVISGGGSDSSGGGAYLEVSHGTSDITFTLTPNVFHVWDEVASLTLTLGDETTGVANEFLFQFNSGSTATTLTLPDTIKWANDSAPTIEANMIYQVSILKGLASVLEFSNAQNSVFPVTLDYNNQDQVLNLRVFNEIYIVAQGGNITLNSGDLTFVLNGNNISVVNLFYYEPSSINYTGYVLYDTGMEYYILNASGDINYYLYD